MWPQPTITPLDGKPAIFFKHMKYLFPNRDELGLVVKYLAWMIQRPREKVLFTLLVVGPSGTGKSWIGSLLEVLLGLENCVLLQEADALKDPLNSFQENKQLVFVHEIPPDKRTDLANWLKATLTEESMWVNEKFVPRHRGDNRPNLIVVLNEWGVLKNFGQDRRWAIVSAADEPYGVDGAGEPTAKTTEYYAALWNCIGTPDKPGDEACRVLRFLMKVKLDGFDGRGCAPHTPSKDDVADAIPDELVRAAAVGWKYRDGLFWFDLLTAEEFAEPLGCVKSSELTTLMHDVGCRKIQRDGGGDYYQSRIAGGERRRIWAYNEKIAATYAGKSAAAITEAYRQMRVGKPVLVEIADLDNEEAASVEQ